MIFYTDTQDSCVMRSYVVLIKPVRMEEFVTRPIRCVPVVVDIMVNTAKASEGHLSDNETNEPSNLLLFTFSTVMFILIIHK